jgi:hypothetical protein
MIAREHHMNTKQRIRTGRDSRRGAALIFAVFALMAAATLVSVTMALSQSANRIAKVKEHDKQARYLAEGAVEVAKREIAQAVASFGDPPADGFLFIDNVRVDWTIAPNGFEAVQTDPAGIQTMVTGYNVTAVATMQGMEHTAHRMVNALATPIFQFAVFYDNDLEINPGPNMTLGGRVHSNSNMYLNSGNTLTVNTNYMRAVGSMFRHRKDDPSVSTGTVTVRKWVDNPFDAAEPSEYFALYSGSQMFGMGLGGDPLDSSFAGWDVDGNGSVLDPGDWMPWGPGAVGWWGPPAGYAGSVGQTVKDSAHGVQTAAVPLLDSIAMFEPTTGGSWDFNAGTGEYVEVAAGTGSYSKGYYHDQAGLSLLTKADGTVKAYGPGGVAILLPAGVATVKSIYDTRQGGFVNVTEINMAALNASGVFPANGLLYAASIGAGTGTSAGGVKLVNGSELSAKLTVVSENAVYVQGNYNSVNKKGAAVLCDAINLLSNNWNDSKTASSSLPTASDTTFNLAFVTGNQETVPGSAYNGGLENLPRFHENWTNKKCTLTGSLVNLWCSQHATGNWVYGGKYYTAPNRIWSYDTAFNSVANLPPFTPLAVTTVDVVVW